MTVAHPFKYRAFLSYSHRDQEAGAALHRALERYRIPRALIGRQARHGPIPAKLRPIFRDRYDLEAGHSLSEQVQQAILESEALIVICSPAAAKSRYVNGEIVAFKMLGRHDRIFPIIVDGEPGDPERECFPPALLFKVGPDGAVTDEKEEPLAADARSVGDGQELAELKLIAGMLGVDLDELRRREAEDERRRKRIWAGIAASMAGLAVLSGFQWWRAEVALDKSEQLTASLLDRASSLVDKSVKTTDEFGVPVRVGVSILGEADGIFADMDRIGGDSVKLVKGRVRMLLAFADSLSRLGKIEEQKAKADEARVLVAGLLARNAGDKELHFLDAEALLRQGHVHSTRHELKLALEKYAEALRIHEEQLGGLEATNPEWLASLASVHNSIAVAHNRSSEAQAALDAARLAVKASERLGAIPGQEAAAAEERVPALVVIADMYRQLGRRQEALAAVAEGIDDVDRTLASSADSVPWLRRKTHFLMIAGDVHRRYQDYSKSLASYEECLQIRDKLHKADVQNATLTAEAGFAHIKVGEALTSLGRLDDAEAQFRSAIANYDAITSVNPAHRLASRQTIDALDGLGEIQRRRKQHAELLATAQRKLDIAERLLAIDPGNRDSQRMLARVLTSLGNAYREQGDTDNALSQYNKALAEIRKLEKPSVPDEQTLAEALEDLGETLQGKGKLTDAQNVLAEAMTLRKAHAERPAATDGAKLRYAHVMQKMADVKFDAGEAQQAHDLVDKAVAIRLPLLDEKTSDESRRLLAYGHEQLGRAKSMLGDKAAAVTAYEKSVPLRAELVDKSPGDAQRRRNLGQAWRLLAEARQATGDAVGGCAAFATSRDHYTRALATKPDNAGWAEALSKIEQAWSAGCSPEATAPVTGSVDKPAEPAVTVPATPAAAEGTVNPNP